MKTTKIYRVVAYVLNLNGNAETAEGVKNQIENNRYPEFINVQDVRVSDCGEWDDDHHLNSTKVTMAEFERYFPEMNPLTTDAKLREELERLRTALHAERDRNDTLERQNEKLKADIDGLTRVREFVKTIGGMIR
jgi:hypothetical protein